MQKFQEVFDHTHNKVDQITDRAIDQWNRLHSFRTDLDKDLSHAIRENIGFPIDYQAPPSFIDLKRYEKMNEQTVKTLEEVAAMRNRGLSHKELTEVELARTLLVPDALAPMHNAFAVYKSLGESKAQTVIRRHNHT